MEPETTTDKTPLKNSSSELPSEAVNYDAIFEGKGSVHHRTEFAQETILGECRNLRRVSRVEWLFMAVATFSLLAVLALTIERLPFFESSFRNLTDEANTSMHVQCDTWVCTNDFIFVIVLLVNIGFCMFYCYDGLLRERPFEILAYVVAVTVVIVYIIVNFIVNGSEDQRLRIARLVLVCVFGPVNIVLALLSWWKMGYFVLNVIGTNSKLIRAYRFRSFFQTVQIFHLELLCNVFVLAWAQNGGFLELWEKVILCMLLFYTVCVTGIGGAGVLWEIKAMAIAWYVLLAPCGVYYVYKVIDVAVNFDQYAVKYIEYSYINGHLLPAEVDAHYVAGALLFACILGLVVVTVLVVFMSLTLVNFGKGLKNKVHPPLSRFISKNLVAIT